MSAIKPFNQRDNWTSNKNYFITFSEDKHMSHLNNSTHITRSPETPHSSDLAPWDTQPTDYKQQLAAFYNPSSALKSRDSRIDKPTQPTGSPTPQKNYQLSPQIKNRGLTLPKITSKNGSQSPRRALPFNSTDSSPIVLTEPDSKKNRITGKKGYLIPCGSETSLEGTSPTKLIQLRSETDISQEKEQTKSPNNARSTIDLLRPDSQFHPLGSPMSEPLLDSHVQKTKLKPLHYAELVSKPDYFSGIDFLIAPRDYKPRKKLKPLNRDPKPRINNSDEWVSPYHKYLRKNDESRQNSSRSPIKTDVGLFKEGYTAITSRNLLGNETKRSSKEPKANLDTSSQDEVLYSKIQAERKLNLPLLAPQGRFSPSPERNSLLLIGDDQRTYRHRQAMSRSRENSISKQYSPSPQKDSPSKGNISNRHRALYPSEAYYNLIAYGPPNEKPKMKTESTQTEIEKEQSLIKATLERLDMEIKKSNKPVNEQLSFEGGLEEVEAHMRSRAKARQIQAMPGVRIRNVRPNPENAEEKKPSEGPADMSSVNKLYNILQETVKKTVKTSTRFTNKHFFPPRKKLLT